MSKGFILCHSDKLTSDRFLGGEMAVNVPRRDTKWEFIQLLAEDGDEIHPEGYVRNALSRHVKHRQGTKPTLITG